MDEMQQITLDQWMSWKEDIREKLKETAGNFVYIGFRLKQIRDSGMFDGAADIFEFAQKEYGLSKSTTSRFIAINEKFSEGGNSLELRQEFQAIGSSKLAEMLTLTDAECLMITERTTVREIRELKNFGKQEIPEDAESEDGQLGPLEKCLVDYFKDKKDMLNGVIKAVYEDQFEEAAEWMNPSGYATHKKGICFMFMYDFATGVKLKLLTAPTPVAMSWKELLLEVYSIFANLYEGGEEDVYTAYYGEPEIEVKKEGEIEAQKVEKTQKNQSVAGSVATSQQEPETEEENGQIVEDVEAEESGAEEGRGDPAPDSDDGVSVEPKHEEDGGREPGNEPGGEQREAGEEVGSEGKPPAAVGKDGRLDKMIRELQQSTMESLEYIKRNVEGDEPDSILVMRAKEGIHELESKIEKLYELLCEKEEEEDE